MTLQTDEPRVPAQQKRSRLTAERIVAAALELLTEKEFEAMTVSEIAARAEVSVGGFYARFRSKEALLHYFNETVLEGVLDQGRQLLSHETTRGLTAGALVRSYIDMAVTAFRRHRPVLKQVALRSRTSTDPAFRERIRAVNRELHDLFRERLYEHLDSMSHANPRVAIDIALTATSGAMREYILFANERPQFEGLEDARLVEELTELFCRYIGVDNEN